ncbi:guanylate cyclase 32E [Trichonephila clavipes]|nr:guanylate cyclase 32E [Trichonephila clavipes]
MNAMLFKEWFHDQFVPAVKKFNKENDLPQRAILLIDNAPSHPGTEELSSGEIKAIFLSTNVTPLLQPMDQDVLQKLKQIYLLEETIWPTLEYAENQPENDVTSLLQLVQTIPGCEEAGERDINKWMEGDGEPAKFLTDDDIAAAVTQEPMEEEGSDDETQCDKKDVVPHADGAAALDLALCYLEQQPDTTPADVLFMRRWRNYASSKRLSSLRRKKITELIKKTSNRLTSFPLFCLVPAEGAYLYDAVHVYARALNECLLHEEDPYKGRVIFKYITERTYFSAMGYMVYMDENGDAEGNYTLIARKPVPGVNGEYGLYPVGVFQLHENRSAVPVLQFLSQIDWVGGSAPSDEPSCGFYGEKCVMWKLAMGVTGGLVVVLLIVILVAYKNWAYEQELDSLIWKIDYKDIQINEYTPSTSIGRICRLFGLATVFFAFFKVQINFFEENKTFEKEDRTINK